MNFAEDMERRIARALDGKFYLPDGRDFNVIKREQEAMRAKERAITENRQRDRRRRLMARNAAKMELRELDAIQISARKILLAVSYAHGVPVADILGPARARRIIYARQHACHVMRHIARMSFPAIGDELARDHSTAQHSCSTWDSIKSHFAAQVAIVNSILIDGKEVPA